VIAARRMQAHPLPSPRFTDGAIGPRPHGNVPKASQYVGIADTVLTGLSSYTRFLIADDEIANAATESLLAIRRWLDELYDDLCGHEFVPVDGAG
jgi:hypothetical protein